MRGVCLARGQLDVVFFGLLWDKPQSAAHLMHSLCTSTSQDKRCACLFQSWGRKRFRSSWGHAVVFVSVIVVNVKLLWKIFKQQFFLREQWLISQANKYNPKPIINCHKCGSWWGFLYRRSKKDKSKGVMKAETSDPEPEGLTLLVPDIQKTAEIVYAATTNLRQANHGENLHIWICSFPECFHYALVIKLFADSI